MHFFVVCVADTLSATVPAHIPQFFPTVEDAQRKQHSAVEQNADCKDHLSITPFRVGESVKAQHTEMSKHVGDGNQNQPFYQTARLLLFAQIQPYYTEDHKQDYVYRQPVAHRKPWQRHPSATVGFNLAVDAHSAVTGALVNKLRKIDEQFMTILGLYSHILCAGFGEHPVPCTSPHFKVVDCLLIGRIGDPLELVVRDFTAERDSCFSVCSLCYRNQFLRIGEVFRRG